eukprot:326936-Ditylum_brightwellii.AAC.1
MFSTSLVRTVVSQSGHKLVVEKSLYDDTMLKTYNVVYRNFLQEPELKDQVINGIEVRILGNTAKK